MRGILVGWALSITLAPSPPARAEQPIQLRLWPGAIPGESAPPGLEKVEPPKPDESSPTTRITYVGAPSIDVYRAPVETNTGVAVVIAPGGGYNILAIDKEGTEVAEWLNSIGVSGIVLKYRVPRRPGDAPDEPPPGPLQDAQRAISLVRSRAKDWDIDPSKIGMLGFSAGGSLTARVATNFNDRSYPSLDAIDDVSCRPDFCALIYPGALIDKEGRLRADLPVSADTPPMFFAHAHDDRVSPENSATLYLALKRAGVPAELHIYESGGHGFGLRPSAGPSSTWPDRCKDWLHARRVLPRRGRE